MALLGTVLVAAGCGGSRAADPRPSSSPAATPPSTAPTSQGLSVTTYRYDGARSGVNDAESVLTPAAVTASFGRLFSRPVDGQVYAQPLVLCSVVIGGAEHDVVFVATQHDSVYAFDANDTSRTAPLWKASLLDRAHGAAPGATTVPSGDVLTTDVFPEIGITGTPVIDAHAGILYVVSKTKEGGAYFIRLHALDVATGAEKLGGPVIVEAAVAGTGDGSANGTLAFDPLWANHRAALTLAGGAVYLLFASYGDNGPYHGWVIAYDAATLRQRRAWADTANGSQGGIWMSGCGLSIDAAGNGFLSTGNGTYDEADLPVNYGESVVKLDLSWFAGGGGASSPVVDWFTPADHDALDAVDADLGSTGVLLLPDQPGAIQHLALTGAKNGRIYLLDRDALGRFDPGADHVVQSLTTAISGGLFGMPTYWKGNVYVNSSRDTLKSLAFAPGDGAVVSTDPSSPQLDERPSSVSSVLAGFPGISPIVSASGSEGGVVWALQTNAAVTGGGSAVLRAYDASDLGQLLWSSDARAEDDPGPAVKFTVPVVVNGKVYVGAGDRLSVYGLVR
jgi:hypothetical protein